MSQTTGAAIGSTYQGPMVSRRYISQASLFGVPLVAFAHGADPSSGERFGHARGVVAVGDVATGFVAVGGVARGFLCLGGVSLGVFSVGGVALGAAGLGGLALGGACVGGLAIGIVAVGGLAIGVAHAFGGLPILLKNLP